MEEIQDMLPEGLQAEPGQFTLDPARALEVLAKNQLKEPSLFLLKLIQWAISSQATRVDIQRRGQNLTLTHDGQPVQRDFLDRSNQPHLLSALAGARAARAGAISLHSWDERGEFQLHFIPGQKARTESGRICAVAVEGLPFKIRPDLVSAGLTLILQGWLMSLSFDTNLIGYGATLVGLSLPLWGGSQADFLLRAGCQYAPIPVYLNGKALNRPLFGWPSRLQPGPEHLNILAGPELRRFKILCIAESDCQVPGLPGRGQPLAQLSLDGQPMVGCRFLMYRDTPGKSGWGPSRVEWVKDGVVVCRESLEILPRGVIVVADAHDLQTDLSQFALVRDPVYDELVQRMASTARDLLKTS